MKPAPELPTDVCNWIELSHTTDTSCNQPQMHPQSSLNLCFSH